jgi:hypothetical protein
MGSLVRGLGRAFGATWRAIRARPALFLGVAVALILFDFFLPPVVLAVLRKPWNYFSFNPWLPNLPSWLVSPQATPARKVQFLSNLWLLWFIANNSYGEIDWEFTVGVLDVLQWLYMGALFGAYFALWFSAGGGAMRRPAVLSRSDAVGWRSGLGGALLSTLGLVTSPCTVVTCGLLVLLVVGFMVQGATIGTLVALAALSHTVTLVVLIGMTPALVAMGWMVAEYVETAHVKSTGLGTDERTGP